MVSSITFIPPKIITSTGEIITSGDKMAERKMTAQEEQQIQERIMARDTRNILLGAFMSMISSITTLYVVNRYLIPKTAAAAVAEYVRTQKLSSERAPVSGYNPILDTYPQWTPLSYEQLSKIKQAVDNI